MEIIFLFSHYTGTGKCYAATRAFLNLLQFPEIDSKESIPAAGGLVRQPYSYSVLIPLRLFKNSRARICNSFRSLRIDSGSLCSLVDRYDKLSCYTGPPGWELIPGLLKRLKNTGSAQDSLQSITAR